MNNVDKQYLELLSDILDNGTPKHTRAGDTISIFGRMMRFNLKEGLPILTTKKVFHRGCIEELLWFLKGDTNIKYLVDRNVHIWDDDAYRYFNELIKKNNDITKEVFPEDSASRQITWIKDIDKETFLKNIIEEKTIHIINDSRFFADSGTSRFKKYVLNYKFGDLGPVYGKSWRNFGIKGIDQIQNIIDTLKTNPDDRRMLCITFNPDVLDEVALPPCHYALQFYTKELKNGKRELSLLWNQRSVDSFLGLPYNILSYSILTHMIAQVCDMEVGEVICSLGDTHLYTEHIEAVMEQMSNDPEKYDLPTLKLNPEIKSINDFTIDDIHIENYQSYPTIKAKLLVG